jgi:hypothetical protein
MLNVNAQVTQYPNPDVATFFDDFFSDLYDNRVWTVIGTGGVISQNVNGGVFRVRANAGSTYEMNIGDMGVYSVSKNFIVEWRAAMIPSAGGSVECGLEGAGDQSNNWLAWRYAPGINANFLCETGASSGNTTTDSGVVGDGNYHLFKVVGSPGFLQFFLDDVMRATLVTNISASQLQPYIWNVGAAAVSDIRADYCMVTGDRA